MKTNTQTHTTRTRIGFGLFTFSFMVYACLTGGNLYQCIAEVPNWATDMPTGLQAYQNFTKITHAGYFFQTLVPLCVFSLIAALVLLRNRPARANKWLFASLGGIVFLEAFTLIYFMPINLVIFLNPVAETPAAELIDLGTKWVNANYLRVTIAVAHMLVFMRTHSLLSRALQPANETDATAAEAPIRQVTPAASY